MREEPTSLLSLTREEMQTIEAAASLLRPEDRDQFLRSVANRWARDFNLIAAIQRVLSGYGVAAGPSLLKGANHAQSNSNNRRRSRSV
jgi:hypothetical protein